MGKVQIVNLRCKNCRCIFRMTVDKYNHVDLRRRSYCSKCLNGGGPK